MRSVARLSLSDSVHGIPGGESCLVGDLTVVLLFSTFQSSGFPNLKETHLPRCSPQLFWAPKAGGPSNRTIIGQRLSANPVGTRLVSQSCTQAQLTRHRIGRVRSGQTRARERSSLTDCQWHCPSRDPKLVLLGMMPTKTPESRFLWWNFGLTFLLFATKALSAPSFNVLVVLSVRRAISYYLSIAKLGFRQP